MSDSVERELAVFSAARRLAAEKCAAYLDEACAGDAALRERVEELLRAGKEGGRFLQDPAGGAQRPADVSISPTMLLSLLTPGEKAGDRIGHYKLLQQIGEGGCGVVYLAEQEEPVRRRVALKIIKLGMDTKQVIARFEAELQALALMDHPHIAKVLEAGATDAGRPYFVMELVRGVKITAYCDQNNLSTHERLKLFIQVCHAVQHAHQKGIIHRDIKPSNVLVASNDGAPVPKVIDFGIAKATQGRLTDQTLFTAFEQFIGTPAYASPEQAELTMLDVDTRTDIYSLGVLLYELLIGKTPFDTQELLAAGLEAMRRTIREQEPEQPSTRLSTMAADVLTATAKHRQTEPPRLLHLIRGDLDWIVMKALEKDRARRYETANGLAMDVQRHLKCEPVIARPPSRLYEFQKTVRRHRFGFAAAAALILVLALGVVLSTSQAIRATRAERAQAGLRREAEAEAAESRRIAMFLDSLAENLRYAPNSAKSESDVYRQSLGMWMRLLSKEHREVEDALACLAQVLQQGELAGGDKTAAEAAQKCHSAMEQFEKLASDRNHHYESRQITAAYESLGGLFEKSGQTPEAEKVYRDTLILWGKLAAGSNLEHDRFHLGFDYEWLGNVLRHAGRPAESLDSYRAAQAVWLKLVAEFNDEDHRMRLGFNGGYIGLLLTEAGRFDEAAETYRRTLPVWKKLASDFSMNGFYRGYLSETLCNLAMSFQAAGRRTEAAPFFSELAEQADAYTLNQLAWKLATGPDPKLRDGPTAVTLAEMAAARTRRTNFMILDTLAAAYAEADLFTNAVGIQKEAAALLQNDQEKRGYDFRLKYYESNLPYRDHGLLAEMASTRLREGNLAEAERLARECLTIREREIPGEWRTFNARSILGAALLGQKKYADSEPFLLSSYEPMRQLAGTIPQEGKVRLRELLHRLVQLYEATARPDEAAKWKKRLSGSDTP